MTVTSSELLRDDVLDLLSIASDMDSSAISRLLTKFCEFNSKVRFASLWRLNKRSKTISIYARSESDYLPQLGENDEFLQEFLCPFSCPSVQEIIESSKFATGKRCDYSIRKSSKYGIFHPLPVVEEYDLDHFVVLPILAQHAPIVTRDTEVPRFFCLFYCPLGIDASDVADIDLELVGQCLGKMIYNQFNELRWKKIKGFTSYLSTHHNPESIEFLTQLKNAIPCEAVFELSQHRGSIQIAGAKGNPFSLSRAGAERLWQAPINNGTNLLEPSETSMLDNKVIRNVIVYQTQNHEHANRVTILYCNKMSLCPFRTTGKKNFQDDFGFDDELLVDAIGEHIHAFTLTKEEIKRRDDVTRIIAHEIKQPLIDIKNSLANYRHLPDRFNLKMTLDRIQDSSELALMLAKINTELSEDNIVRIMKRQKATLLIEGELLKLKRLLRGICEDVDFKNDNIDIQVDQGCKELNMASSLLATIFLNTVSNSIKYSDRDFDKSWCSFKLSFVSNRDPVWEQNDVPVKFRKSGLLITTTDNGISVPPEKTEKVFEKESRLHHPHSVSGLGLGLYHLRRIVVALEGRVWMRSLQSPKREQYGYSTRIFTLLPDNVVR